MRADIDKVAEQLLQLDFHVDRNGRAQPSTKTGRELVLHVHEALDHEGHDMIPRIVYEDVRAILAGAAEVAGTEWDVRDLAGPVEGSLRELMRWAADDPAATGPLNKARHYELRERFRYARSEVLMGRARAVVRWIEENWDALELEED